jgi:hypothetical protein
MEQNLHTIIHNRQEMAKQRSTEERIATAISQNRLRVEADRHADLERNRVMTK